MKGQCRVDRLRRVGVKCVRCGRDGKDLKSASSDIHKGRVIRRLVTHLEHAGFAKAKRAARAGQIVAIARLEISVNGGLGCGRVVGT